MLAWAVGVGDSKLTCRVRLHRDRLHVFELGKERAKVERVNESRHGGAAMQVVPYSSQSHNSTRHPAHTHTFTLSWQRYPRHGIRLVHDLLCVGHL